VDHERLRGLAERWVDGYDWDRYRARLARWPQVRLELQGLMTHAIHVPSSRPDAVPLLLGHGWPSTCFEFDRALPLLVDPPAGTPAFHVLCPSLPGYGYAGVPTEPGWGVGSTASWWAQLMTALGYPRFVVHGGDWGAMVATEMALRLPERLLGLHLTMPLARVGDDDRASASGAQADGVARERAFRREGFAYALVQATRPQSIGVALDDSPVGLLAWIGEKLDAWSGDDPDGRSLLDEDAVLDVVTTYWLTRTATSSARLYAESLRLDLDEPVAGVPTGCSVFAAEVVRPPRSAVERRYGPLVSWSEVPLGGHFPAAEVPEMFAEELRAFAELLRERA
jgi:pimeloyl-ACP methyl ester carboxylesterase